MIVLRSSSSASVGMTRSERSVESFAEAARAFDAIEAEADELDVLSRDPRLWRSASFAEVAEALRLFWSPQEAGDAARYYHGGSSSPTRAPPPTRWGPR